VAKTHRFPTDEPVSIHKFSILMKVSGKYYMCKIRFVMGVAIVRNSTNPMSSYMNRESDMNNVILHNDGDSDQLA
jgi:hypothetical protein